MGGTVAGLVVIALLAGATALRTRKRIARLEALIRKARALAAGTISFRSIDATWQAAVDGLDVPAGMVALGDLVEVPEGGEPSGAMRTIAGADGTTYGWLAKVGAAKLPVMVLISATETEIYLTRLTPATGGLLAAPPWAHRVAVPYSRTIPGAIADHRERVASAKGLIAVKTLDDLKAELERVRGMTIAWRQTQSPATLLDRDLRSMLGRHYDTLGPRLAKRLAVEMPQARVVS